MVLFIGWGDRCIGIIKCKKRQIIYEWGYGWGMVVVAWYIGFPGNFLAPEIVKGNSPHQGFGDVPQQEALHFLEVFSGFLAQCVLEKLTI